MKSIIGVYLILLMIVLVACNEYDGRVKNTTNVRTVRYVIVNIDGCEYIQSHNSHGDILSHKGNCKNPIHLYNEVKSKDTVFYIQENGKFVRIVK